MNIRKIIQEEIVEFMTQVQDKALGKKVDVLSFDDKTTEEELSGTADADTIIQSIGYNDWKIVIGNKTVPLVEPQSIPKGTKYKFERGSRPAAFKMIKEGYKSESLEEMNPYQDIEVGADKYEELKALQDELNQEGLVKLSSKNSSDFDESKFMQLRNAEYFGELRKDAGGYGQVYYMVNEADPTSSLPDLSKPQSVVKDFVYNGKPVTMFIVDADNRYVVYEDDLAAKESIAKNLEQGL